MTSILYYTNNLLPSQILENTLTAVNHLCLQNNCELIITSHFPITKSYEEIDISESPADRMYSGKINVETKEARIANIYKHLVKDLRLDLTCNHKSYVVGKLPYIHKSIFKQILLGMEKAKGEIVIFMEHDCFYPEDYISAVETALQQHGFGYCHQKCCYLDFEGFFRADTRFMLSGVSGKKDLLTRIFSRKLELLNSGQPYYFEPVLDSATPDFKEKYSEVFATNSACIDPFLPENHDILDIKHKLNQGGQLAMLKTHPGAMQNYQKIESHPYWGTVSTFMDMLKIDLDKDTETECLLGTRYF
jgi:hypothetical protein